MRFYSIRRACFDFKIVHRSHHVSSAQSRGRRSRRRRWWRGAGAVRRVPAAPPAAGDRRTAVRWAPPPQEVASARCPRIRRRPRGRAPLPPAGASRSPRASHDRIPAPLTPHQHERLNRSHTRPAHRLVRRLLFYPNYLTIFYWIDAITALIYTVRT